MKKYVVLFSLETGEYLAVNTTLSMDFDKIVKDWMEAMRFPSEESAVEYLEQMEDPTLKFWCTRTFYELTISDETEEICECVYDESIARGKIKVIECEKCKL